MTKTFFSPDGNPEIWPDGAAPEGYFTPEEWADAHPVPPPPPLSIEQAKAARLAEIIAGSNKAAAWLKSFYSEAEAESWPQQEAGARAIVGCEGDVKDDTAAGILKDDQRRAVAVGLVQALASIDGVTAADFAARIVANADAAYNAKILTLTEQRSWEKALKDAVATGDVAAVFALDIVYSLPPKEDGNGK